MTATMVRTHSLVVLLLASASTVAAANTNKPPRADDGALSGGDAGPSHRAGLSGSGSSAILASRRRRTRARPRTSDGTGAVKPRGGPGWLAGDNPTGTDGAPKPRDSRSIAPPFGRIDDCGLGKMEGEQMQFRPRKVTELVPRAAAEITNSPSKGSAKGKETG